MTIREEELKRIVLYAKGLGIEVKFLPKTRDINEDAEWADHGNEYITIKIYVRKRDSKTMLILKLLHELGHHMDWIYNNKYDPPELIDALDEEDKRKRSDPPLEKAKRKLIYKTEVNGINYMDIIASELNLKVPMWRVRAEMDYDKTIYYIYYRKGKYPNLKESQKIRKRLIKKHRSKYK